MRQEPGLKEDAKNLSLVTGSALVAALLTIGLLATQMRAAPEPETVVRTVQPIVVKIVEIPQIVEPEPVPEPVVQIVTPLSGSNRIYGTVTTVYGSQFTGYIRWDRNEGSWVDLLDATAWRHRLPASSQRGS